MKNSLPEPASAFMQQVLPLLLERYCLSCMADGDCMEYWLTDRTHCVEISQNLMLSRNRFARRIEIIRFYPELHKQPNTKYFSAACFYLLVHHFAGFHGIAGDHKVFVRTQPEIFARFYQSLGDFDFRPQSQLANTIDILADFRPSGVDTSMVVEKAFVPPELPAYPGPD